VFSFFTIIQLTPGDPADFRQRFLYSSNAIAANGLQLRRTISTLLLGGGSMKHLWIAISGNMKNCFAWVVLPAVLLMGAREIAAHSPVRDANPAVTKLDSGTCLVVELSTSLNAKKLQPGDRVTAKVIQAVIVGGKVVIPRGSKLIGNVTEAKARSKEYPESRLGIIFAKVMVKNGGELSLDAIVQALGPVQKTRADLPDAMLPPQLGRTNVSNTPEPMGTNRNSATAGARGASGTPPVPSIGTALTPGVSAGTIPNPKEGLQESGLLSSGSRGIYGLKGLTLKFTGTAQIPVISSVKDDIKLDSGIQMVLRVVR
jgi:hypothetical protein